MWTYVFWFGFFFSSRRRHTRCLSDWSSDVCSSDLPALMRASKAAPILQLRSRQRAARGGRHRDHQDPPRLDLLVALEPVGAQDGRLSHAIGARDLREGLALLHPVLGEAEPILRV